MAKRTTEQDKQNLLGMFRLWEIQQEILQSADSLRKFVKGAWPHVDPAPFVPNWHIDLICEHLQALTDGDLHNLIINVPPRSGKSNLVSVIWPAWVWIKNPAFKWVFTSYALQLSFRDSRNCRTLIKSNWYQKNWADRFKLRADSDTLKRFDNDKMGYRIAISTDSATTGEGGDAVVYDDPNSVGDMNSQTYIDKVIYNHEQVMPSRLNDQKTGIRLVIQQRMHESDLTGHILARETGWDHLVIPMEYEGSSKLTSIGRGDPRTELGQLMWPDKMGQAQVEKLKTTLHSGYAGQYQQRPAPGEGAKFKRQWWNFYNPKGTEVLDSEGKPKVIRLRVPGGEVIEKRPVTIPEAFEQVVMGWDMSFKEKDTNDFVSGQAWGRVGSNSYLLARDTRHMDFPETLRAFRAMSAQFPCPEKMIEDKANGPAVVQTLRNEIPGIIESPITGGLGALANSMTGYAEAGNWYLPNPDLFPWVLDFIEVFAAYPNGKHDDDVAAACHANRRLFDSVSNSAAPEFRVSPRIGEPSTACHVEHVSDSIQPWWRRWIAVAPGAQGAALWIAETPKKSLRVYRELSLEKLDANEAGRRIAEATLPDVRAYVASPHATNKWNIDVLMSKEAFAPIEPIGCYAELVEHGMLSFEPTDGEWELRQLAKQEMRLARFSAQMAEVQESAWDRLRDLLRFKPADYQELPWDRDKALKLARLDIQEYKRYKAAVDGRVEGEYPKIKFSPTCTGTIQALGSSRRAEDVQSCFLQALLIGISAPDSMMTPKPAKEKPWSERTMALDKLTKLRRRSA